MTTPNLSAAPLPGNTDIDELLLFLPQFSNPEFEPVQDWHTSGDTLHFPYPIYHPDVTAFIKAASKPVWSDYDYIPLEAYHMLTDPEQVAKAGLVQVRTMLTYIVRGERFGDGHWAAMITQGHLKRLLERLAELREIDGETS